ncbi:hypothetical protein ACHAXA_005926 [Cyclostephanos tholiformis]|uniref:EngB-type G domain-containing protein n=1 Tax=Cyclostephanos tholiformis TaxID=382380 RepID=A0ABD3SCN9_9STRA
MRVSFGDFDTKSLSVDFNTPSSCLVVDSKYQHDVTTFKFPYKLPQQSSMVVKTLLAMPRWLFLSSKRSCSRERQMHISSLQQIWFACHMRPTKLRIIDGSNFLTEECSRRFCGLSSSPLPAIRTFQETRIFSTNIVREEEEEKQSNRAAFRATPIIPSILAYIEKIGVGMRPKRPKHAKRKPRADFGGKSETLDEIAEADFFAENETQHRLQRLNKDRDSSANVGKGPKGTKKSVTNNQEGSKKRGAFWLPPPPFSSSLRIDNDSLNDSLKGRRVIRRPVKLLGKAGSLHHVLPRESKGLPEVAIAGRSNVGKSTLLNALLYGNTDENLSPRKYQRGGTPDTTKLPKGIKAVTSSKPGQTKELTFYQLTADVMSEDDAHETIEEEGKMSLLLVDLPGYGFAFAKEERTIEWTNLMHHYLLERRSLKRILFLLDARHGFKKTDFDFLGDLQDGLMAKNNGKKRELPPIQIVLTKCDLVQQTDLARRVVIVKKQLSDFLIREPSSLPVMLVSARAGIGFNNVRRDTPMGGVLELQRELAALVPKPQTHGKKK